MTATVPADAPPRTVHVEHCMGTVFTIDVRDTGDWAGPIDDVVAWLHHVDDVFSTYKSDSAISRINRGELRLEDADPDVVPVLELCTEVQRETLGYFTALPMGRIDPTGLVKGWAIERASTLLRKAGSGNHAVNGGGDMQLAGESAPGRPWRVGIADPTDRSRVVTVVSGRDLAVATSGTAERGLHIVNPFTGSAAAAYFRSATVVGPSLTRADAYATAAFVMGAQAPRWADTVQGYETLLIAADGTAAASSDWRRFG
jgi:thiamine biosynthesis lipoprotein